MGRYASTTEVLEWLNTDSTAANNLINRLLDSAESAIDTFCRRRFDPYVTTKRYNRFYRGRTHEQLFVDDDLLTVDTLINGSGATIPNTGYWLEPRNDPPYGWIRLQSQFVFTYNTDADIIVTGTWGYAATVIPQVTQAAIELTEYLYRLRDASTFNVSALPEVGQITIAQGWPTHISLDLEPFRRRDSIS